MVLELEQFYLEGALGLFVLLPAEALVVGEILPLGLGRLPCARH
jgi:hypothetical protein